MSDTTSTQQLNWPGLLAWSTKYHDGTAPSKFNQMSEADKAFLEQAMESAFAQIEDMNKVLKDGLRKLEKAEDFQTLVTACEIIERCVDDPDCARNLEVFNGLQPLLQNVFSPHQEVANRCCGILSMMLANNEKLQLSAVQKHKALEMFLEDPSRRGELLSSKKRVKLLADIVRGVSEIETEFVEQKNGIHLLCGVFLFGADKPEPESSHPTADAECSSENGESPNHRIASEQQAIRERAITFLRHLLAEKPERARAHERQLSAAVAAAYKAMEETESANARVNIQYSENLAQLTLVVAEQCGDANCKRIIHSAVKARMEAIIRKGREAMTDHEVEVAELKAILTRVMK
eukprot:CAMPEP_0178990352 /NCGR_PEP_ID=MMETSP0795-20121207/4892_1 /TAXON_ID=88552 /ORGANISM="Amoebophrya sp., Strain Ameob2" /LENGTH=348 /DNA_ID=CAMNT_0020681875 /DNA_START=137 /DNA_END=1183 /DNA_ORIENTATION=+